MPIARSRYQQWIIRTRWQEGPDVHSSGQAQIGPVGTLFQPKVYDAQAGVINCRFDLLEERSFPVVP
jgi:hypothetical protein